MEKFKHYFKKAVVVISLYLVCQLFVVSFFEVDFSDGGFIYAIAGTILIIYLYGDREKK